MTRRVWVFGAGGHGRVVADAALGAGYEVMGFFDAERAGQTLLGLPVLAGEIETAARVCAEGGARVALAVGGNRARATIFQSLSAAGVELATVVHPSAVRLARSRVAEGAVVLAGTILGVDSIVGEAAIINTAATIDHDCSIGAFAHLSPGVHTGGQVEVGEGVHLAVGVSVRNQVRIGGWSVVGVGAAVVKDLPPNVMAVGVPARVVKTLP